MRKSSFDGGALPSSGATGCCTYRNLNTRASYAACLMVASITGCSYTFSVYSGALSKQFGLSDSQLATLSSVYFCTGIFSWIPGLLTDIKGPKFVVRVFGVVNFCALLLYWAVSRKLIDVGGQHAAIASLAAISVVVYFGSAGITGAVFSTLVRTHPGQAGTVVGVAKGWVGMCGGMVTQVYAGLVRRPDDAPQTLDFLLFVAIVIAWGTFLPSQLLVERRDEGTVRDAVTAWDVRVCYAILLVMGSVVTAAALAKGSVADGCAACPAVIGVFILVVWNSPFALLAPSCTAKSAAATAAATAVVAAAEQEQERGGGGAEDALLPRGRGGEVEGGGGEGEGEGGGGGGGELTQFDLRAMLKTGNFWLLLWSTTVLIGCGIMVANNAGQMCKALGFDGFSSTAVTLFSVSQSFARVVAGLASDRAYARGVARPIFFTFAALTMALAQLVLSVGHSSGMVALGVVLCGLAFGSTWPLMVLSVSELFGAKHLGGNYMVFDGCCSALGTLGVSKFLAEAWYNEHTLPGAKDCYGTDCFQNAHVVMVGLALSSAATSFVLWRRSRSLYRRHAAAAAARAKLSTS